MRISATQLELPAELRIQNIKTWVEEQIWGHRFYNDQTPWLMLLEFLSLCAYQAVHLGGNRVFPGTVEKKHEFISYELKTQYPLRYLLFRDRNLDECEREDFASETARLDEWIRRAKKDADVDYGYLRDVFIDFRSFASAVNLLRSAEIEQHRDRRWSSRHLAPVGPDMLMADYKPKPNGARPEHDRRFFARGGELVYLMLNRSSRRESLDGLICSRLLADQDRWNRMVNKIISPASVRSENIHATTGYLPLAHHPRYDLLAEDWHAILSLARLPSDHLIEPLMRITALNVILYIIERASEELERNPPPLPIDVISAGNASIRKLSTEHYHLHREMSREAIKHRVNAFTETDEWKQARVAVNRNKQAMDALVRAFRCRSVIDLKDTPERQVEKVIEQAIKNHDSHLGRVPGFQAQQIGLAISRTGAGRWYSFSDSLVEALVLTNVTIPMEYGEFLQRLWNRYRMVIGPAVAEQAFRELPAPREQFKANQERLEDRLRVLGLLRRLSDDCAFVENPFVNPCDPTRGTPS